MLECQLVDELATLCNPNGEVWHTQAFYTAARDWKQGVDRCADDIETEFTTGLPPNTTLSWLRHDAAAFKQANEGQKCTYTGQHARTVFSVGIRRANWTDDRTL